MSINHFVVKDPAYAKLQMEYFKIALLVSYVFTNEVYIFCLQHKTEVAFSRCSQGV